MKTDEFILKLKNEVKKMMTFSIALLLTTLMGTYVLGLASLVYLMPENPGKKIATVKVRQ